MCTNPRNITLPATFQGDTWGGLTWAITAVDPEVTEFTADLALVRFQLQNTAGSAALTLSSAAPGEITINSATANAWSATIEPRVLALDSGVYSFGMEFTDAEGTIKTHLAGTLEIISDPVL
jgi:hypothetical protein